MKEFSLQVLPQDAGKRLDIFIVDFSVRNNLGLSREEIQRMLANKQISLKNTGSLKPHYKVKTGDEFNIRIEEKKAAAGLEPEKISLDVVYEDADLAVINKPAGLVVHPAPGNAAHTLVNALLYRFPELSTINPQRPGIVHRLDKETSGLLVIAKNNTAHLELARQFAQHSIKRQYFAVVKGKVEFDENVIELPIGRHPYKRKSMAVAFTEKARYAKTHYRTIKRTDNYSLLELEPFTGRTHQLRVHLAFLDHPILGDTKYGRNNEFSRLALHARYLGFNHPVTGKFMEFSSEIPPEFGVFMEKK